MLSIEEIREKLQEKNLKVLKNLGQNFLVDEKALEEIVSSGDLNSEDIVLEVGPGMGVLTFELAKKCKKVIAIEKDRKMSKLLKEEVLKNGLEDKIEIICSDILSINLPQFLKEKKIENYKLISNVPYYITSPIIKLFLETEIKPELIVILIQKEVAERICSEKGNLSVLALSVLLYGKPEMLSIVGKESFFPSPKVDSAILKISEIENKFSKDEYRKIFRVIKVGFSAKRKKLVNNLASGLGKEKEEIENIFADFNLDINVRAQDLEIKDWVNLSQEK